MLLIKRPTMMCLAELKKPNNNNKNQQRERQAPTAVTGIPCKAAQEKRPYSSDVLRISGRMLLGTSKKLQHAMATSCVHSTAFPPPSCHH